MSTSSVGYLSPQACVIATELLKQSSYQLSLICAEQKEKIKQLSSAASPRQCLSAAVFFTLSLRGKQGLYWRSDGWKRK